MPFVVQGGNPCLYGTPPPPSMVAAACSCLQRLTLSRLLIQHGTLFTALAWPGACPRLTHLTLDHVVLHKAAAKSLGYLATGLKALQQLAITGMEPSAFICHPLLLPRITSLTHIVGKGWLKLLQRQPHSFQRLQTLSLSIRQDMFLATFRTLCASLPQTQIHLELKLRLLLTPDCGLGTWGSLPPALTLTDAQRINDILKLSWVGRVGVDGCCISGLVCQTAQPSCGRACARWAGLRSLGRVARSLGRVAHATVTIAPGLVLLGVAGQGHACH